MNDEATGLGFCFSAGATFPIKTQSHGIYSFATAAEWKYVYFTESSLIVFTFLLVCVFATAGHSLICFSSKLNFFVRPDFLFSTISLYFFFKT